MRYLYKVKFHNEDKCTNPKCTWVILTYKGIRIKTLRNIEAARDYINANPNQPSAKDM